MAKGDEVRADQRGKARVTREVTLSFEEFGWETLESEAGAEPGTLDEWLARAVAYFDEEVRAARAATVAPRFKLGDEGTSRDVRLTLAADCWERLVGEAGRQGIPIERLLEHAALLHLADIESGRVAARVVGRAEEQRTP